MTIHAWRIFKARLAAAAFTGEGARRYGGRWNNKGTAIIYTAGTASLAVLEMLVHLDSHEVLDAFMLTEIAFEDSLVEDLDRSRLPRNWRSDPAPPELRLLGDQWVAKKSSAVLRVPSVLIETESNYLLNPAHSGFSAISLGTPKAFAYDPRFVK